MESLGFRDSSDVERVEVHDTITITRTITVQTNDKGDTLKVVQITDLTRARSRDNVVAQRVKTEVRVDTVYVEKRDSSLQVKAYGLQEDGTPTISGKLSAVSKILKWIFALVCAIVVLILVIRFGRRGLL